MNSLFISYSHTDNTLCDEFLTSLAVLISQGRLEVWRDRNLTAGQPWQGIIDDHLNTARFLVLLLSGRFFQSDQCKREMARALERQAANEAILISVILEPCDWQSTPLAQYVVLPRDGKPVTDWPTHAHAWQNTVREIRRIIDGDKPVLGIPIGKTRRWLWPVIIALVFASATLLCRHVSQNYTNDGDDLIHVGRYLEAKPSYQRALLWFPLNARAALGRDIVDLSELRGDAVRFSTRLAELTKLYPKDPHLKVLQGDVLAAEGDARNALARYQEAVKLDPELAEAYFRIGVLYDQDDDLNEAKQAFEKAVGLAPESPHYRTNLGTEYRNLGDIPKALEQFQIAMNQANYPLAAIETGKIHRDRGDLQEAERNFRNALDWLQKPVATPEAALPWFFHTDQHEYYIAQADKLCYAALELESLTHTPDSACTPAQRTLLAPLLDWEQKPVHH